MKRGIGFLLSLAMLLAALGPIGAGAAVAKAAEGDLPESYYVQPPVGTCASCGAPLFAREGNWGEHLRLVRRLRHGGLWGTHPDRCGCG